MTTNQLLTKEQLQKSLPKDVQLKVTDNILDSINSVIGDPTVQETFRENILGFSTVLRTGKYKFQSYVDAVKYVSYKMLGATNIEAYTKTFPERYQNLVDEGTPDNRIHAYVAAYNKNQLVNKLMEQTLVPTHILNADIYQKAINVQANLMMTAKSEKVRSDAANSLMTQLRPPETKKIELDVGLKEDQSINELRNSTMELVAQQRRMIESGMLNAKQIAHSKIIQGELADD